MLRKFLRDIEGNIFRGIFFICAFLSIIVSVVIVYSLISQAWGFFSDISVFEFISGTRWSPILKPRSYGVLPLVSGTLLVSAIAAMVAVPVGVGVAMFLSEYASNKTRKTFRPLLEILAGVPCTILVLNAE